MRACRSVLTSPLLYVAFLVAACQAQNMKFSIPAFNSSIVDTTGDATIMTQTASSSWLSLTRDTATAKLSFSGGRAMYKDPVQMCDGASNITASFSTTFVFSITFLAGSVPADGLTFVITKDRLNNSVPDPSVNGGGGYLALTSNTTDGNATNGFVAVEFDTYINLPWDPLYTNHVGIDVNGVRSLNASFFNLTTQQDISAWIDYDGEAERLQVYVANNSTSQTQKPLNPILTYHVNLCSVLAEAQQGYVGFTAATGSSSELHYVKSWTFSTSGLPSHNPAPSPLARGVTSKSSNTAAIAGITVGIIVPLILITTMLIGCKFVKLSKRRRTNPSASSDIRSKIELAGIAFGPQKFNRRELWVATRNFSSQQLLGKGGFGSVYKAILNDGSMVAVKRVSKDSKQGEREFVAEVNTIGRLRHRNLVRLLGWCCDREELLLVYEYVPQGSLDKLLFAGEKQAILSWEQRRKIVCGLASALCYLHYDWEKQVIHRDVKASNVMLDAEFEARLGDFGLARLAERDKNLETTVVAGTPGYMAPEYMRTGKATAESDVFSYGAVVLEVASGRRPVDRRGDVVLVDWVWELHREGRLLEAADAAMGGEFDERGMERVLIVGLACSHPEASLRPSMRRVLQLLLEDDSPLPSIPIAKPAPFYGSAAAAAAWSSTLSTSSTTASSSVGSSQISAAAASASSSSSVERPLLREEDQ